jgi:hypothetical protein
MLTVKEFSIQEGVTTQAVYKLLKTHEEALEGHVQKQKKGRLLDEFAVAYLQEHMVGKSIVVMERAQNQEIEELKVQVKKLQDELIIKNSMLIEAQNKVLRLEDNSLRLEELQAEVNRYQPIAFGFYRKK